MIDCELLLLQLKTHVVLILVIRWSTSLWKANACFTFQQYIILIFQKHLKDFKLNPINANGRIGEKYLCNNKKDGMKIFERRT